MFVSGSHCEVDRPADRHQGRHKLQCVKQCEECRTHHGRQQTDVFFKMINQMLLYAPATNVLVLIK